MVEFHVRPFRRTLYRKEKGKTELRSWGKSWQTNIGMKKQQFLEFVRNLIFFFSSVARWAVWGIRFARRWNWLGQQPTILESSLKYLIWFKLNWNQVRLHLYCIFYLQYFWSSMTLSLKTNNYSEIFGQIPPCSKQHICFHLFFFRNGAIDILLCSQGKLLDL